MRKKLQRIVRWRALSCKCLWLDFAACLRALRTLASKAWSQLFALAAVRDKRKGLSSVAVPQPLHCACSILLLSQARLALATLYS